MGKFDKSKLIEIFSIVHLKIFLPCVSHVKIINKFLNLVALLQRCDKIVLQSNNFSTVSLMNLKMDNKTYVESYNR